LEYTAPDANSKSSSNQKNSERRLTVLVDRSTLLSLKATTHRRTIKVTHRGKAISAMIRRINGRLRLDRRGLKIFKFVRRIRAASSTD
jgi:hypothetical protein